mgnify:CR=1 FL=1
MVRKLQEWHELRRFDSMLVEFVGKRFEFIARVAQFLGRGFQFGQQCGFVHGHRGGVLLFDEPEEAKDRVGGHIAIAYQRDAL